MWTLCCVQGGSGGVSGPGRKVLSLSGVDACTAGAASRMLTGCGRALVGWRCWRVRRPSGGFDAGRRFCGRSLSQASHAPVRAGSGHELDVGRARSVVCEVADAPQVDGR